MRNRLIGLLLVLGAMAVVSQTDLIREASAPPPTLVLGFLLLAAYCIGYFGEALRLPRITGYILAGLALGPFVAGFFNQQAVADLGFLTSLALAFIAFCAGGELKLSHIRDRLKSIGFMLSGISLAVLVGVSLAVFALSSVIPFMKGYPVGVRLAIAAIFGVISTARSPSSAIAIITETKAKGPLTDTVLAVTVAMDVVVIMLFAVVISVCQVLIEPGAGLSLTIAAHLLVEIVVAFVLGHLLGRGIIYLVQKVGVELPIIIAGMGFLVIKFCHGLGDYFQDVHDLSVNLEPLLICMAAGFTVQNFSDQGDRFLHSMNRVSLPIYVGFFALTGASIQLEVLKAGWLLGLMVVVARGVMIYIGSYLSARAAGDEPAIYKNAWLGFVTQAGVSLGLVAEVARRFPEIGVHVQTILIAAITLNQIVGPVAFKYVLGKVGEARAQPASG